MGTGAWASGGTMNQARSQNAAIGSSQTTAMLAGGNKYSPGASYTAVEQYNGSSWTEITEINTSRGYCTGAGTPAGALCVSGILAGQAAGMTNVESWNGSAWTEVSDVNTLIAQAGGSGSTNTAAITIG